MNLPKTPLRDLLLPAGEGRLGNTFGRSVEEKIKGFYALKIKNTQLSFPHRHNYLCEDAFVSVLWF